MKVLIADPDWTFLHQAREYLEDHAHVVVHHPSPAEAVAKADHWRPDLVILAAELADSGIIEELHRMEARPAVLLVEHMDRFDRAWRAWQRGGDDVLLKPIFSAADLRDAVVGALENAAAGQRTAMPTAASA